MGGAAGAAAGGTGASARAESAGTLTRARREPRSAGRVASLRAESAEAAAWAARPTPEAPEARPQARPADAAEQMMPRNQHQRWPRWRRQFDRGRRRLCNAAAQLRLRLCSDPDRRRRAGDALHLAGCRVPVAPAPALYEVATEVLASVTIAKKRMTLSNSSLPLAVLVVGFALASGCGRTEMDLLASVSGNAGRATGGRTGNDSSGAGGGGAGGVGQGGSGGVSTGGAGGGASGVCGEALCLASLFQTCVPEGDCFARGGGSPSASFSDVCYSNGVTVSSFGTYKGVSNVIGSLTVSRNGILCYEIDELSDDSVSYVISDGNGRQVATGIPGNDVGFVTVTCNGSTPTTVGDGCLYSAENGGECTLETCP